MTATVVIREELPKDRPAVLDVHFAAFDNCKSVPDLVADLSASPGNLPNLSLVAVDEFDSAVGHVFMSAALVDGPRHLIDVLVLSPIGVRPDCQGQGIGTALLKAAIFAARTSGAPLLFLEGSHRFYGPRGFEKAMSAGFRRPSLRIPENAFQVARLDTYEETMTGTFVYRDVHWRHGIGLYKD